MEKIMKDTLRNLETMFSSQAEPLVRKCPYCGEQVTSLPPEAIDYCAECEVVTEGETVVGEYDE